MPTKRKIDDVKLKRMVKDGKSIKHCACHFGVTTVAIHQRLKLMDVVVSRRLAIEDRAVAERLTKDHFDAVEELQKIHASATELLTKLEQAQRGEIPMDDLAHILGDRASLGEFYLKTMGEVRKQLALAAEMSKQLFSIKEVQDFQNVVIETLKEADPAIARRVVEKLVERRALCSSLSLT